MASISFCTWYTGAFGCWWIDWYRYWWVQLVDSLVALLVQLLLAKLDVMCDKFSWPTCLGDPKPSYGKYYTCFCQIPLNLNVHMLQNFLWKPCVELLLYHTSHWSVKWHCWKCFYLYIYSYCTFWIKYWIMGNYSILMQHFNTVSRAEWGAFHAVVKLKESDGWRLFSELLDQRWTQRRNWLQIRAVEICHI